MCEIYMPYPYVLKQSHMPTPSYSVHVCLQQDVQDQVSSTGLISLTTYNTGIWPATTRNPKEKHPHNNVHLNV